MKVMSASQKYLGHAREGVDDADEWEYGKWNTSPFLVIRVPSQGITQKRLLKVDWKRGAEESLKAATATLESTSEALKDKAQQMVDRFTRIDEAAAADGQRNHAAVHWLTGDHTVEDLKAAAAGLDLNWRTKTTHPGPAIFRKGEELPGTTKLSELEVLEPTDWDACGINPILLFGLPEVWYGEPGTNEFWSPGWQHSVPALPLISLLVCVGGPVAWGVTARQLCNERVQDCTPAVIT